MPDSKWVTPPHHAVDSFEQRFDDGQPPETGMRREQDETTTTGPDPLAGVRTETRTVTFSDVIDVIEELDHVHETCSRCGFGHSHSVTGSQHFTPDLQEHVPGDYFGDHSGVLTVHRLHGTEIRRQQTTMIRADGVRIPPLVQWDRRNVDHTETRIRWDHAITNHPCALPSDGVLTSSGDVWMEMAMALVDAEVVADPVKQGILLDTFEPIVSAAVRLEKPSLRATVDAQGHALVLAGTDSSGSTHEVGRISVEISETAIKGLEWQLADTKASTSVGPFVAFGSQRTKTFVQTEGGAANDLHIRFAAPATVFTDPDSGNAGPFQDIAGNGTDQIDLSNATGDISTDQEVRLKFRSESKNFPKITQWQWTKDGQRLGSPHVETE